MAALKRRDFLRYGAGKTAELALQAAGGHLSGDPRSWIRPPFALPEPDFVAACTKCDACIASCPHHVVFRLSSRLGDSVGGTPALDLTARGCHLCADWPCVTACAPGALRLPEGDRIEAPKLARARINASVCLPYSGPECGACAHTCPVPGALQWPDSVKPVIDDAVCTGCGLCREACITEPKAISLSVPAADRQDGSGTIQPTHAQ